MPRNYRTDAIVLKRREFGETDKLLTLLTPRFGKITAIAKGIRNIHSRKAAHLEVFNHSRLFLAVGKSIDIITEAQTIYTFSILRKKLDRIVYAYRLVEQIDRLCPEHQSSESIYSLLLATLHTLDNKLELDVSEVTDGFTSKLLFELGFLSHNSLLNQVQLENYLNQIMERTLSSNSLLSKISFKSAVA